jgi:hypothetical protein
VEKDARLSVAVELEYFFISQVVLPLQLENMTVTYSAKEPSFFSMTVSLTSTSVSVQRTAITPGIHDTYVKNANLQ